MTSSGIHMSRQAHMESMHEGCSYGACFSSKWQQSASIAWVRKNNFFSLNPVPYSRMLTTLAHRYGGTVVAFMSFC